MRHPSGWILTTLFAMMALSIAAMPQSVTTRDDAASLTARARAQLRQGNISEAEQLLNRALRDSPNSPEANNALGKLLLGQHRYPEAMDRFETVLATNLRDGEARKGELRAASALALQARAAGNQNAALACLKHARENLPNDPTLLTDLGIQAHDMKLLVTAHEALAAALALKPDDLTAMYAIARVETDQQHFPAAERHFRAYLAARPKDATAHYGLGRLLAMELRNGDAKAEFERSIALQPVQTESYYELGQMALDARHDAEAEPLFRKVLTRDPKHGGALAGMGILSFRRQDYASAESYLAKAVGNAPDYQPAHYYYGLTLARLGKKEQSERELQIAISLQPSHARPTPVEKP